MFVRYKDAGRFRRSLCSAYHVAAEHPNVVANAFTRKDFQKTGFDTGQFYKEPKKRMYAAVFDNLLHNLQAVAASVILG